MSRKGVAHFGNRYFYIRCKNQDMDCSVSNGQ